MELGGNVWMLDRDNDKDGPWTLVRKKAPKKAGSTEEGNRKYTLERERPLLEFGRDGESTANKKTIRRGFRGG